MYVYNLKLNNTVNTSFINCNMQSKDITRNSFTNCHFNNSNISFGPRGIIFNNCNFKGAKLKYIVSNFINGEEVFTYSNPIIGGQYNTLKSKKGEKLNEGYISLQSESHPIEFKNIELLILQ